MCCVFLRAVRVFWVVGFGSIGVSGCRGAGGGAVCLEHPAVAINNPDTEGARDSSGHVSHFVLVFRLFLKPIKVLQRKEPLTRIGGVRQRNIPSSETAHARPKGS